MNFQIGEIYENRIGAYEVVHMNEPDDTMVIRYLDSGESAEIRLSLQARIVQHMDWEAQQAAKEQAQEDARHQTGYGTAFTGLEVNDFKTNTEGTTWRSRKGLAGAVARALSEETPYTFVSWAIYRWPVAFLTHREDYSMAAFEMGSRKAKFTLELDEEFAHYGFYIERNAGAMDHHWDWPRFMQGVAQQTALQQRIERLEKEHGYRMLGRASAPGQTFHFSDGLGRGAVALWDEQLPSSLSVAERLQRLDALPDSQWGELYIIASAPKADAIPAGIQIAESMAATLRELIPVYTAATRHGQ